MKNIADDRRDADLLKYKSLRNRVVGLIREEKRRYFENNSSDQKVFWKAVRMLNNTTSSIPTLVSHCDGSHATTSNEKAKLLNHYFYSCFNKCLPPLSDEDLQPPASTSCSESILIAEEYVASALQNLDVSKSTGIDDVSARMLKHTALSIAPSLTKLFNLSITAGCPDNWKIARIVPIPKADDMSSPTNFRPISILPIVSKVLERHISNIIMDHLEHVAPISPNQWSFMPGRSTISALLSITNTCLQALDDGHDVCTIFFDIHKAFDSVPHQLLMEKLKVIGLNDYLLHWLHTYLSNRKQVVVVDGVI